MNKKAIDEIINFLKEAKDVNCSILTEGPGIEEIYGTPDAVYGKARMTIEITFDDLYKRTNDLFSNWEKVKKSGKDNKK